MKKTFFDTVIAGVGGLTAFLFGEIGGVLYALIALIVLDYVTGVVDAAFHKKISSGIGFKGIQRKAMIFIVVAVANIIDVHVLAASGFLRSAVIFFFIANEGISILENAGSLGVPIPRKLLEMLEQLKSKNNNEEDNNND
ncbi:MAG: phage holin family protein [Oscillospiraceae bacterium]|nr:phage holin family protein [Oscillospiraceae bacterium]